MLQLAETKTALAELDELSARVGVTPDPSTEAELIHTRHRLGRELLSMASTAGGGAIAPTALGVDDPFPEVVGRPPQIDLAELDVGVLRGALAHHGCLLVKRYFSTATMAVLRNDIDQVSDAFDRWMASQQTQPTTSWFEPFEAADAVLPLALRAMCGPIGTFYAADAPRAFLHLIEAFAAAGMPQLVCEYMNEPVLLGLEKTSVRRVPPNVPNAWHQDGLRFGRDVGLINAWVALCHCGVEAPTLGVIPKRLSEILPLDTESVVPWEIRHDALVAAGGSIEPVELELEPGDAMLFDEMLAHSTITNDRMTKKRYCADAWFFPVSRFPTELYKPLAYAVTRPREPNRREGRRAAERET